MGATATANLMATDKDQSEAGQLFAQLEEALSDRRDQPLDLTVTPQFARLLSQMLTAVAQGKRLTVTSLPDELTTSVAAEQLGVSRPTLMKWIRDGDLPSHKKGTHTRLATDDVLALRAKRIQEQRKALEELLEIEDRFDIR